MLHFCGLSLLIAQACSRLVGLTKEAYMGMELEKRRGCNACLRTPAILGPIFGRYNANFNASVIASQMYIMLDNNVQPH